MDMFGLGALGSDKEGGRLMMTIPREDILKDVQFRRARPAWRSKLLVRCMCRQAVAAQQVTAWYRGAAAAANRTGSCEHCVHAHTAQQRGIHLSMLLPKHAAPAGGADLRADTSA